MILATDGAIRDGTAVGSVFIKPMSRYKISNRIESESNSTSQRAELLAIMKALEVGQELDTVYIVTDSEYAYNGVNKEWFINWKNKGWKTADGTDTKNADLWEKIAYYYERNDDVVIYHVKGHVIPFGKVTSRNLLQEDLSGEKLYHAVKDKFKKEEIKRQDKIKEAAKTFKRINGFHVLFDTLMEMSCCNITADLIASYWADKFKEV